MTMRRILLVLLILGTISPAAAQLFNKERLTNLENFDKRRWSWGYYIGFNQLGFKFRYDKDLPDIQVEKQVGFNVGLMGNLRINQYVDLRLAPGMVFSQRNLVFPGFTEDRDALRDVRSTYIHIPLLVKFSTKRLNNLKPFIIGGVSTSFNLSSNETNPEDNSAGQFRMTTNTYYYEVGLGIDLYLYYFKFTPSIRGVFAMNNELVPDADPNSPWTSNIAYMGTRGFFINFTFQ